VPLLLQELALDEETVREKCQDKCKLDGEDDDRRAGSHGDDARVGEHDARDDGQHRDREDSPVQPAGGAGRDRQQQPENEQGFRETDVHRYLWERRDSVIRRAR